MKYKYFTTVGILFHCCKIRTYSDRSVNRYVTFVTVRPIYAEYNKIRLVQYKLTIFLQKRQKLLLMFAFLFQDSNRRRKYDGALKRKLH